MTNRTRRVKQLAYIGLFLTFSACGREAIRNPTSASQISVTTPTMPTAVVANGSAGQSSYVLSGIVWETTPLGRSPIEDAVIYCDSTRTTTNKEGTYSCSGVSSGITT